MTNRTVPSATSRTNEAAEELREMVESTSDYSWAVDFEGRLNAALSEERRLTVEPLLEIAERYHSGHSIAGKPCRCDNCRELRAFRTGWDAR